MNTGLEIDHDALMTIELFRNSNITVSAWTGYLSGAGTAAGPERGHCGR
jgi:hypothetical protein